MSFYWQNAVPQESGQSTGSTWDNINLGNMQPQQQHVQRSFSYENQQNSGGYEQYVNPYADQWAAYHAQQAAAAAAAQQQQQQQQQIQSQQQAAVAHQPQIEHQPILAQPPVEAQPVITAPTTDYTTQESQSNHTAYDGWGHEGWSSHEPSVKPQVQPPVNAHQYYYQQQQYYQEQIPQQAAQLEQSQVATTDEMTSNATTLVPSTTSTVTIPSVETVPVESSHPIVKPDTPQPSPQPVPHYEPVVPAASLDLGFSEVENTEEKEEERVEIKLEPQEEVAEVSAVGWGEEWKEEEREKEMMDTRLVASNDQPRTSTPSPVEHTEHREPEPTASPIEATAPQPSAPSPSPSPVPPPTLSSHSFPPPAPPPPPILPPVEIVPSHSESSSTKPSPLPSAVTPTVQATGLNTENTQKTSPPASLDSWVEVSSSGSDAVGVKQQPIRPVRGVGVDGVSPIDASSPARPEKRSSVSSAVGVVVENGLERRREDSDSTHDGKINLRDKFKSVKNQYPEIFNRFSQYRHSARDHSNKTPTRGGNPLLAAASHGGVRVGVPVGTKNSTPKDHNPDTSYPPAFSSDISAIEASKMYGHHADHSLDMSLESRGYGEELVDAYRKDRHRAQRTSRPASRARSEYGEPHLRQDRGQMPHNRSMYDTSHMMHPQYGFYAGGRYSLGRHSSMGMPYVDPYEAARRERPHSTYDHAARMRMERSGRGPEYDAYEYVNSAESDEDEDDMQNESDNEMRRISHNAAAAAHSRSSVGLRRGGGQSINRLGPEEINYFGFVKMEMSTVYKLLASLPPPPDFWELLEPIERVAYLYRTALQGKNYQNVGRFKDHFRFEFYKFKLAPGCTEVGALIKMCELMQCDYKAHRLASSQRAYEASQRQLFSDDRETPESRLSDRPSIYDQNQTSDVDDYQVDAEPLKFRLPHAFATFGPGGKVIQVQPSKAIGAVMITDVNDTVRDREMQRIVSMSNHFKGPLFPDQTPPQVVKAYIHGQMERIKKSDLAVMDPRNDDIIDCLLIWQLLEKVVQQHGKVTGPDIAELLVRSCPPRRERGGGGGVGGASLEIAPPTVDPRAYESFTHYLLQGLVDHAIDFAMSEGLFMDAITLARRLAPNRVEEIEKKHLSTRPPSHPVLTLLAVASNQAAPCLNQMASEERGGWRWHAALIFANLKSDVAMDNIQRLGEELVRRDCNAAADFCFLSVALVAGKDTFTPMIDPSTGLLPSVRRHIELIHASIPDDVTESAMCEYGFSLTDLHATEIFDFGSRLSGGATNLAVSAPYQRRRIQYAKLLASWGGFSGDSFRYCVDVATKMWGTLNQLTTVDLEDLVELADRLHKMAAADETQTMWIGHVRQMLQTNAIQTAAFAQSAPAATQPVEEQQQQVQQTVYSQQPHHGQQQHSSYKEERSERSESISAEAAAWHSREEPLEMRRERRESEGMYGTYQQQQQHHPPTASSESHHESWDGDGDTQSSQRQDDYSSGRHTEGAVTSEESTPMRERSTSIHEDFHPHSHHSSHSTPSHSHHHHPLPAPSPNPLAPTHAPAPATTHAAAAAPRVPAPMPAMPALPFAPTPAAAPPVVQQQQPQSRLIKQETAASASNSTQPSSQSQLGKGGGKGSGTGWSGWLKEKVIKAIPSNNPMILPDDTKKTIRYDEKLGRYVGEGVEEETAPPPPPGMMGGGGEGAVPAVGGGLGGPPTMMGGGLRAARNSGGSRYFNPLNDASKSSSTGGPSVNSAMPPAGMPAPPTFPTQFSFIPTMPDDAVADSPFSERPAVPEGTERHQEQQQQ